MEIIKYIVLTLLAITELLIFVYLIKSQKPIKLFLLNLLLGIFSLVVVNLTVKFTGIMIPVNIYTVGGASIFGTPAVIGFLILKFVFI